MKRHEALEAYRRARAAEKSADGPRPAPPAPGGTPPSKPRIENPSALAAKHCEEWIAADDVARLIEHHGFITNPALRRKLMDWAVEKARGGNLEPLLAIGIDDVDASVRRHVEAQLGTLPAEMLLKRLSGRRFTARERCVVAGLLGRCTDPKAGRYLAGMADDNDARVRESTLAALVHHPVTPGLQLEVFTRRLEQDASDDVRTRAAEGLAQLGTSEACDVLERAAFKEGADPQLKSHLQTCKERRRGPVAAAPTAPAGEIPGTAQSPSWRLSAGRTALLVSLAVVILGFAAYRIVPAVQHWRLAQGAVPSAQAGRNQSGPLDAPKPKASLSKADQALHRITRNHRELYHQRTGRRWEDDAE